MMRTLFLATILSLPTWAISNSVAAEAPPTPLAADQRARISELAQTTQAEVAKIKERLEEAQRELAAIYAIYELDAEKASQLEQELLDLQRQLLANYRRMQTELRTLVSEERFALLRRRLDNLLSMPGTDGENSDLPVRDAVNGAAPAKEESADEPSTPIFSGPQVGEVLPPLPVRGVFDEDAGKELDFVTAAEGKPIVLVFVHEMNRPSIGMTRALTAYTQERAKDGLATGIVWLSDDVTEAENTLKRMRHALAPGAPIGISPDGKEGPGSYGLNRNVALTILVADKGRVTDNFALVQPSVQADLPKIFAAIVRVAGGQAPKVADIVGGPEAMRGSGAPEPDPRLRELIRPLIQLDADEKEVDRAAAAIESYLQDNVAARKEVGRIASTIVGNGKLSNYGTARAQEYLRKWAEQYGRDVREGVGQTDESKSKSRRSEAPSR